MLGFTVNSKYINELYIFLTIKIKINGSQKKIKNTIKKQILQNNRFCVLWIISI